MKKLMVDYSKLFSGLKSKPTSYKTLADKYEWEKRDVEQNYKGRRYDEFNNYMDNVLRGEEGKLIVECGCGLGPNLLRFADKNICIGFDFSKVALNKLHSHTDKVRVARTDILHLPVREDSVDFVVFSLVLFVFEDLKMTSRLLMEAQRILRPGGKVIIVNDYCNYGVNLCNIFSRTIIDFFYSVISWVYPQRREFICYYFSLCDMRSLLDEANLTLKDSKLCDLHQGIYHLTYLNFAFAVLFRSYRKHKMLKDKDHWQRVENARDINDAYPLNWLGRQFRDTIVQRFPQVAALRLCCLAEKKIDVKKI